MPTSLYNSHTTTATNNNHNNSHLSGNRGGEPYTYNSIVSHLSAAESSHEHLTSVIKDNNNEYRGEEEIVDPSYYCQGSRLFMLQQTTMKLCHTIMIQETILCFGILIVGCYGPKYWEPSEDYVRSIPIPYQVLTSSSGGDVVVVLDFDLNHPLVDPPTIDGGLLIYSCILVPLLIICTSTMLTRRRRSTSTTMTSATSLANNNNSTPYRSSNYYELQSGICAFFLAIGSSEGFTQLLKHFVSRKRPNFYQLCGFNTSTLQCEAPFTKVAEAMRSFPSGHTSLSFCGMTFVVWFLLGRVARHQESTSTWTTPYGGVSSSFPRKVLVYGCMVLPWSYSTYVGATRIVDYWHHVDDVLAGCLLGTTCATVAYHVYHPPVVSRFAGIPWNCGITTTTRSNTNTNSKNNTTTTFLTSSSSTGSSTSMNSISGGGGGGGNDSGVGIAIGSGA